MSRYYTDWIEGYLDYAAYSEAPKHMHFWTAVSAIAGALRRKVWIDMAYFRWYPNFYIILVAPPGIVSKSTTAGIGMDLLRAVPGVHFGPDVVTWPALVQAFAECTENFEHQGMYHPMSAMTLESSEFGNLLKPEDREMVDLFVSLWDGKQGAFKKSTKGCGTDVIENPWINMIACTTPGWIAGSFPEYMIGGGFTSRCVFVYADMKAQYVAYPHLHVPSNMEEKRSRLIADLEQISQLAGQFTLSEDALAYGQEWYQEHYTAKHAHLDSDRFGGYLARKQTHIHKLAMVLAAATGNDLVITAAHLRTAHEMVTCLEPDMAQVFAKIGKSEDAVFADRLVDYVFKRGGVPYVEVWRFMQRQFGKARDCEEIFTGCVKAGKLILKLDGAKSYVLPGVLTEGPPEGVAGVGGGGNGTSGGA